MTRTVFHGRVQRGTQWLLVVACVIAAHAMAQPPTTPPPTPPAIARVQGRPITQADFDRISGSYFAQLRAQYGGKVPAEVMKIANQNVMDELVRRELLVVEFERRGMTVEEAETDVMLRQDPFFLTAGKFDEAKFRGFKTDPGSNYLTVLPKLRELAGAAKLDRLVRDELRPSRAQVRAEWTKRSEQARFEVLGVQLRDMSPEPEATLEEQRAFHAAHPERFERKARLRLRYVKLPLPAKDDSSRAASAGDSLARGLEVAAALRAGTSIDSIPGVGPVIDTGLFELPALTVPGLGSPPELIAAIAPADSDTTVRVVGPWVLADGVIVGEIAERVARVHPPFSAVRVEAKRFADEDKRRAQLEVEKRNHYAVHPEPHRVRRMSLTRVTLAESKLPARWPSARDVERWYQRHAVDLFPDSSASTPPLSDSLRGVARERVVAERRAEQARRMMDRVALGWGRGRDPHGLVRGTEAVVETLSVFGGYFADSLFPPNLCDSLLRLPEIARPGEVQGARSFFGHAVAWRVDRHDTAYTQPYDLVHMRVEQLVQDERRARDESEAKTFFEAHRDRYLSNDKYALEIVAVRIPPPDSVVIAEDDLDREYRKRLADFREEAHVRARHILISGGPDPAADRRAKALADSLRGAILAGTDFGELARTFSKDPGSAIKGGDLGFFGRGRMVKAFEDTSFALELGVVSQPVETQFGYHLIQVEERRPERVRLFEEVRRELRSSMARALGDSVTRRTAERIRRELASGVDPAQTAAAVGGVQTLEPVAAGEALGVHGAVPGLESDLTPRAVGRWLRREYRAANAYLVVKPVRHLPPGPAEYAEVKSRALNDMREAKRREFLDRKVTAIRERLAAGERLDSVAMEFGGLREVGPVPASAPSIPLVGSTPSLLARVFAMKPGETSDTLQTSQGVAWVRVKERGTRADASFEGERAGLAEEMLATRYADWVARKRRGVKVEILRQDLRVAPAAPAGAAPRR